MVSLGSGIFDVVKWYVSLECEWFVVDQFQIITSME